MHGLLVLVYFYQLHSIQAAEYWCFTWWWYPCILCVLAHPSAYNFFVYKKEPEGVSTTLASQKPSCWFRNLDPTRKGFDSFSIFFHQHFHFQLFFISRENSLQFPRVFSSEYYIRTVCHFSSLTLQDKRGNRGKGSTRETLLFFSPGDLLFFAWTLKKVGGESLKNHDLLFFQRSFLVFTLSHCNVTLSHIPHCFWWAQSQSA